MVCYVDVLKKCSFICFLTLTNAFFSSTQTLEYASFFGWTYKVSECVMFWGEL